MTFFANSKFSVLLSEPGHVREGLRGPLA